MKLLTALLATISGASAITIGNIAASGSGCPTGSVVTVNSITSTTVDVTVSSTAFVAAIGGGAPITDQRKFCQLSFDVTGTAGKKYAFSGGTYTGHVNIPSGATGQQRADFFASRNAAVTGSSTHSFTGPDLNRDYSHTEPASLNAFTACGIQDFLNAKNSLQLNGAGTATLSGIQPGGGTRFVLSVVEESC